MVSPEIKQMYQEIILDLANENNARYNLDQFNKKIIQNSFLITEQFNPNCGDKIKVAGSFTKNKLDNYFWTGLGCNISMASANYLGEWIIGKTTDEVLEVYKLFLELMNSRGQELTSEKMDKLDDLSAFIGVAKFPARIKCALLAWEAIHNIIVQNQNKAKAAK
ncbi:MAG: SUF system NifU family Fe-S cluster assembly protein [Bifidobacteriaceae bacterium]|jgi:nitrogen fixation NifU-like protein|nr:SUF system NifU family Fe-S cluster assembly protein [Bifidobacteriaceae bacterium]